MIQVSSNRLRYFPEQLSADEVTNPLLVLHMLYQKLAPLPAWKQYLRQWLKAMFSPTFQWVGRGPGETVFIGECFEKLIEAAWLLHYQKLRPEPILDLKRKHLLPQNLPDNYMKCEFYPLTLEKREIENPYLVLDAFFEFRTVEIWREDMQEWLNTALSNRNIFEYPRLWELIISYEHLEKLLEATHLIWVREI